MNANIIREILEQPNKERDKDRRISYLMNKGLKQSEILSSLQFILVM